MYKLTVSTILLAIASAAQLPSPTYLPSAGSGPNSGRPNTANVNQFETNAGIGGTGNTRPQQEIEKNAAILKLTNDIDDNGFQYSYETSNGIQAEESGNSAQTRGGFAYKGDDGQIYSITFTAGEDGFRPQGAHLPVPPPTPAEILLALQQNAKDEAAGIFDDGKYRPDKNHNQLRPGQVSSGSALDAGGYKGNFNSNSGYTY